MTFSPPCTFLAKGREKAEGAFSRSGVWIPGPPGHTPKCGGPCLSPPSFRGRSSSLASADFREIISSKAQLWVTSIATEGEPDSLLSKGLSEVLGWRGHLGFGSKDIREITIEHLTACPNEATAFVEIDPDFEESLKKNMRAREKRDHRLIFNGRDLEVHLNRSYSGRTAVKHSPPRLDSPFVTPDLRTSNGSLPQKERRSEEKTGFNTTKTLELMEASSTKASLSGLAIRGIAQSNSASGTSAKVREPQEGTELSGQERGRETKVNVLTLEERIASKWGSD
ncbi:hypothetical protein P7C70_g5905, partial [Phenoliferia sp. Uapishka_3]